MVNVFRSLLRGNRISVKDIELLFRTATDFKDYHLKKQYDQMKILPKGTLVGHYSNKPRWSHTAISRATYLVGGKLHQLIMNDWEPCHSREYHDLNKILLNRCDILLMSTTSTCYLDLFQKENLIPIINSGTGQNHPVTVLNHLFTLWEHFQDLHGLHVGWIGPTQPLLNSYLGILPKLQMNIKYTCPKIPTSPSHLNVGMKLCEKSNSEIKACTSLEEVLKGCEILVIACHNHTKLTITEDKIKNSASSLVLIYEFSRTEFQVINSLIVSPKNLSYKVQENLIYVWMAILILSLTSYQPKVSNINLSLKNQK